MQEKLLLYFCHNKREYIDKPTNADDIDDAVVENKEGDEVNAMPNNDDAVIKNKKGQKVNDELN